MRRVFCGYWQYAHAAVMTVTDEPFAGGPRQPAPGQCRNRELQLRTVWEAPLNSSLGCTNFELLTATRSTSARIALHACAISHQREIAALRAHLAFVAFGLGFG